MWPVFTHWAHCSSNTILSQGSCDHCQTKVFEEGRQRNSIQCLILILLMNQNIYIFSIFIPLFHSCEHKNMYIKLFLSELFDRLLFNRLSFCPSVTCFLSNPQEPVDQFQPNLAQSIFLWKGFKWPRRTSRGDNDKKGKIQWRNLKNSPEWLDLMKKYLGVYWNDKKILAHFYFY